MYPQIKDDFSGDVLRLVIKWAASEEPTHYCGETRCTGACGLSALVMRHPDEPRLELKARSSATASGHVMQPWAVSGWAGPRSEVPEKHRAALLKAYWR